MNASGFIPHPVRAIHLILPFACAHHSRLPWVS